MYKAIPWGIKLYFYAKNCLLFLQTNMVAGHVSESALDIKSSVPAPRFVYMDPSLHKSNKKH